ncbi:STAS domain-containing protein [Streptomyces longwoodensis]|uniref:STAS domain-containing protein n=1 Tax=Streptomyces longwoodensis TaxID=68231 RepID=UPI0036FD3438
MNGFERFRSAIADEDHTITVVAFSELDLDSVEDLRKIVDRCLLVEGVRLLVVDMSQVNFCDCSGVGALMEARERTLQRRISFELTEVKEPIVMRLFTLTGTDALFGLDLPTWR